MRAILAFSGLNHVVLTAGLKERGHAFMTSTTSGRRVTITFWAILQVVVEGF